jgi:hypothetical protein
MFIRKVGHYPGLAQRFSACVGWHRAVLSRPAGTPLLEMKRNNNLRTVGSARPTPQLPFHLDIIG